MRANCSMWPSASTNILNPARLLKKSADAEVAASASGAVIQECSSARPLCRGGCGWPRCIAPGIGGSRRRWRLRRRRSRRGWRVGLVARLFGAVILDRQTENHDDGNDNDCYAGPHCAGTASRFRVEGGRGAHIGWPARIGVAWIGMPRVRHWVRHWQFLHDRIHGWKPTPHRR